MAQPDVTSGGFPGEMRSVNGVRFGWQSSNPWGKTYNFDNKHVVSMCIFII